MSVRPIRPVPVLFLLLLAFPPTEAAAQKQPAAQAVPDATIEIARAAVDWVRDEHFVQPPATPRLDTFRVERDAIAIVEPADDHGYLGSWHAASRHARAVARAMGVPFDQHEAFLDCARPAPSALRTCSFRRGIESFFRFEDLRLEGDEAQIVVAWSFIVDQELTTHRYTLRVERTSRCWTVQAVLLRELY